MEAALASKTLEARDVIEAALRDFLPDQVRIMASFGKDSMAVVHLAHLYGVDCVLYLPDEADPEDAGHREGVTALYGLQVEKLLKGRQILAFPNGLPFLIGFVWVSDSVMMPVPTPLPALGTVAETPNYYCVDEELRAEHGVKPNLRDVRCLIFGTKRVDFLSNDCLSYLSGLPVETRERLIAVEKPYAPLPGTSLMAGFPLWDWTDEDVWEYVEAESVPVSREMYDSRRKQPSEARYCYACHNPKGPQVVGCPRYGRAITNLGSYAQEDNVETLVRLGLVPKTVAGALKAA